MKCCRKQNLKDFPELLNCEKKDCKFVMFDFFAYIFA